MTVESRTYPRLAAFYEERLEQRTEAWYLENEDPDDEYDDEYGEEAEGEDADERA